MKPLMLLSLLFFLASCKGTGSGNPPSSSTNLAVTASPQSTAVAQNNWLFDIIFPKLWALPVNDVVDSGGLPVLLNKVWSSFKEVRFKLDGSETESDDTRLDGPFNIDLLSNDAIIVPELVITGTLDEIEWRLDQATLPLPSGAPAELLGNSLIIKGEVFGNSFTFLSDENTQMSFQKPEFGNLESSNLVVNILLKQMISKIDLSTVTSGEEISQSTPHNTVGSACTSIDPSANTLYTCFRKGLESEYNLGADNNGDLEVDD